MSDSTGGSGGQHGWGIVDWSIGFGNILRALTANGIVLFPYFFTALAFAGMLAVRKRKVFEQEGLPIFAIVFVLPFLLFAWNKGWVNNQAGVAILSSVSGYIFGRKDSRTTDKTEQPTGDSTSPGNATPPGTPTPYAASAGAPALNPTP